MIERINARLLEELGYLSLIKPIGEKGEYGRLYIHRDQPDERVNVSDVNIKWLDEKMKENGWSLYLKRDPVFYEVIYYKTKKGGRVYKGKVDDEIDLEKAQKRAALYALQDEKLNS